MVAERPPGGQCSARAEIVLDVDDHQCVGWLELESIGHKYFLA